MVSASETNHNHIVPNSIPDESAFEIPITELRYSDPTPVYVGHLGYFPNIDAVRTLANQVTREAERGGATFLPVVAGRSPSKVIRRLSRQGRIELIANPISTLPILANYGYAVMPLRHGSGTRIKILEALAAGVVVIASKAAREGLDITNGKHFFECESPAAMARTLHDLSHSPGRAVAIALSARSWALHNYGNSALRRAMRTALAA